MRAASCQTSNPSRDEHLTGAGHIQRHLSSPAPERPSSNMRKYTILANGWSLSGHTRDSFIIEGLFAKHHWDITRDTDLSLDESDRC
jgi:hypothetical protein